MNDPISNKETLDLSSPFGAKDATSRGAGGIILSLLVAADEQNVIGKDNKLPWHLPNDLRYFKNLTWGLPILMGRKTFESIGRPLPGRKSVVITRNKQWQHEGVSVVHSLQEAVQLAKADDVKEIFVIGGAEIFHSALPQADRLYVTRIHHRFAGDVFLPEINTHDWQLVFSHFCAADEKNAYDHTFQVWEKNSSRES